jgi:RimJ/RimL family protein N-acetyltransferase
MPVLMGRRVLLREPTEDDGEALFRHTSDPEVTRFLAFASPKNLDETLYFIAKCHEDRVADREYVFVIADIVRDEVLGITGLRHVDRALRTAQVGTWVARERWGTGVNAEAKALLFDFAFDRLGLHRIEARIAVANARSRRAFEKLGATCEGVLRESFFKDGVYQDQHLYVLLEQDWRRRRSRRRRMVTDD